MSDNGQVTAQAADVKPNGGGAPAQGTRAAKPPSEASPPAIARSVPPAPAPARPAATTPVTRMTPTPTTELGGDGKLVLGKGVSLTGHVTDATSVHVEGNFTNATVEAGELNIGNGGRVTGRVAVTSAEIRGQFEGDLTVQEDLVVHETGSVSGMIRYGEFQAARGARLEGDIRTTGSETPGADTGTLELDSKSEVHAQDAEPQKRGLGGMLRRK